MPASTLVISGSSISDLPHWKLDSQPSGINRISNQVLSRIFIICDRLWYADAKESNSEAPFGCQLVVPAVCRSWRKVALETTALWTRVTLADHAPFRLSELFLARSGDITPLDIDISMTGSFWKTDDEFLWETEEELDQALEFIVAHGGVLSRWRSFRVEVDNFYAFFAFCPFFKESPLPALESLELAYTGTPDPEDDDGGLWQAVANEFIGFKQSLPRLSLLKLRGLYVPFVSGESVPERLPGLKQIEYRFGGSRYEDVYGGDTMYKIAELLPSQHSSTRRLSPSDPLTQPKVSLSKLVSLSFLNVRAPLWVFNHLITLEGPNVASFQLTITEGFYRRYDYARETIQYLVCYIATGALVGAKTVPKPLFPSLSHLTLATFTGFADDLETLLSAYPCLVSLTLPECSTLAPLFKQPWLVPNLSSLKAGVKDVAGLKKLVIARREAGIPLRTVQVGESTLTRPIEPETLGELQKLVDFSVVKRVDAEEGRDDETGIADKSSDRGSEREGDGDDEDDEQEEYD